MFNLADLQAPAALAADCDDPADLPDAPMPSGPAERAMAHNIVGLIDCKSRKKAEGQFYRDVLARLGGLQ